MKPVVEICLPVNMTEKRQGADQQRAIINRLLTSAMNPQALGRDYTDTQNWMESRL